MLEDGGLAEKLIIWTDKAHFWLNEYVDKNNYRFRDLEN